jgi:3D (Asp-Asp-Asp) domain-containing protein/peptidoglycan hydrolase CwlO-like protein
VLGQALRPQLRLLGIAAAVMTILVVPGVGGADPTTTADALRQENANLASRSRAAVLSLYSLDSRLDAARTRLADLRAQAGVLRRERASLKRQLGVARVGVNLSQRRLAARLRLLYEQGDVTAMEVLLGAKSLDEALTGLDNLDRVATQDQSVLAQLRTAKRQLATSTTALAARVAKLEAATRAAAATAASLERAKAERSAYISSLANERRLNSAQISSLEAAAQAATIRTQQLTRTTPDATLPSPVASGAPPAAIAPLAGAGTITVSATGYALSGTTATGIPVGWGVAAVDPRVIPLGTHMTIPGYGEAVAADTGGAVVGATIDLWFPSVGQAQTWGRRTVTITLH